MSATSFLLATLLTTFGADAKDYPKAELLAEAADLAESARVLDARPRAKYEFGHIPNAVWVDYAEWSKVFDNGKDPEPWAKRIGALGIKIDTPVVIYDDANSKDAARIWWILRFWGVKDVRLLNGGWYAWKESGGKTVTEEPKVELTTPKLKAQDDRLATKDQVLQTLKEKSFQIIDARTEGEFCGEVKSAKKAGAIPEARQLEWSDLIDAKTQRFKPAAELSKLFADRGIKLDQPVTTYCQSGGRASVMAFGLELMGADKVRNYYKSWAEWGNDENTPIVIPAKTAPGK
jgi:thiosulfate/3-mercaptopyruvate sulfurtransferase